MDEASKEEIVRQMLIAIGEDPSREGLRGTPERVARMWNEIFRGYDKKQLPKVTTFTNGKDGIVYDQMITDDGPFYSQCEHHMVPFHGHYYFAYLPHPEGKLLGLSKVARVVDYFAAKLQIQERLTHEVVNYIWSKLSDMSVSKYPPLGMALVMEAEHLCKTMRGVKKQGRMRTTKLLGAFKKDAATRAEFMAWANNKR